MSRSGLGRYVLHPEAFLVSKIYSELHFSTSSPPSFFLTSWAQKERRGRDLSLKCVYY